ncbi:MAG: cytochrome c3 family protein [Thermodesulfobacteriota bacterium]|nr:cytochrome c3 family protein [Thermodesulfobacteriota bacterium]
MKGLRLIGIFWATAVLFGVFGNVAYGEIHHVEDCTVCHYRDCSDCTNERFVRCEIDTPNSGIKDVAFTGPDSYVRGEAPYDGVCEACHTQTAYHTNTGSGASHFEGQNCITCHPHRRAYAGKDIFSASDAGLQSHDTHMVNANRGPGTGECTDCHSETDAPVPGETILFADPQPKSISETTVCNSCHSKNGLFDGTPVAKANWNEGVYEEEGATLKSGNEQWCAGCHDEVGASSKQNFIQVVIEHPDAVVDPECASGYPDPETVGTWGDPYTEWAYWIEDPPEEQYGENIRYTVRGDGSRTVTWIPDLPKAGQYSVYAWWKDESRSWRSEHVPYTVYHVGGSERVEVSQVDEYWDGSRWTARPTGGRWQYLGSWDFAAGTSGYVVLSNDATGAPAGDPTTIIADAVKFVSGSDGIVAPNVVGGYDEVWDRDYGFYETGHKIDCLLCHDATKTHIDHEHRTYEAAEENHQEGYRLKTALAVPRPVKSGNAWARVEDAALCWECHNPEEVIGENTSSLHYGMYDLTRTNFRDMDGSTMRNLHNYHFGGGTAIRCDSDFDGVLDSAMTCTICHNVHGAPNGAMIRHGELMSVPGNREKVPAMNFTYYEDFPQATATYLALAGTHEVYGWWYPHSNRASNVFVTIQHSGGAEDLKITQQIDFSAGAHTAGANGQQVLQDVGKEWTDDVFVGKRVLNTTDGCWGEITTNNTKTITTSGLAGSYEHDFDGNDAYAVIEIDPNDITSGRHTGPHNMAILTDSTKSWMPDELVGLTLHNAPDGSKGTVTANTATTVTAILSGGRQNDWDNNETYEIRNSGIATQGGSLPSFELILDDPDAAFVADCTPPDGYPDEQPTSDPPQGDPNTQWAYWWGTTSEYGNGFRYKVTGSGSHTAAWTPDLFAQGAGQYSVFARWVAHSNRPTDAEYTINHNGTSDTVYVNQEINDATWVYLGSYYFAATGGETIVLSDNSLQTGQTVSADAIRLAVEGDDVLTDDTKQWVNDELIGKVVLNTTDLSWGMITANTATTITATLANGTDCRWDADDAYEIVTDVLDTGTYHGNDSQTVLIDVTKNWAPDELQVGWEVFNTRDGSSATISAFNDNTIWTTPLTGGGQNDWDTSDGYQIPRAKWHRLGSGPYTFNGSTDFVRIATPYYEGGSHTGANDQVVLTDATKNWAVDELVGFSVYNSNDGSQGIITANSADTITAALINGCENDWDSGDSYKLVIANSRVVVADAIGFDSGGDFDPDPDEGVLDNTDPNVIFDGMQPEGYNELESLWLTWPEAGWNDTDFRYVKINESPYADVPNTTAGNMRYASGFASNHLCADCHSGEYYRRTPNMGPKVLDCDVSPASVPPDGATPTLITARVVDPNHDTLEGYVTVDLSALGGSSGATMYDDGTNGGDVTAGDDIFSLQTTVPQTANQGTHTLLVTTIDPDGCFSDSTGEVMLEVVESDAIVLDDPDAAIDPDCTSSCDPYTEWDYFTTPQQYGSWFRYKEMGDGSGIITWKPNITTAGQYQVFAWWDDCSTIGNSQYKRSQNVPYTIYYNGGSERVEVDQTDTGPGGGKWNLLGTYEFSAGTSGYVILSDDATLAPLPGDTTWVIGDAIKWIPVQ